MRHKIQITVDDELYETITARAKQMSLSVSLYARIALVSALPQKKPGLLAQGLEDIRLGRVETLTRAEFNKQMDDLENDSERE